MNSKMLIELIGYFGSLLVVVSMLMTSVKKLRLVNCAGSLIFAVYALIIKSYPTAFMNFFLVAINVVNLYKLFKGEKNYNVIECFKDESVIQLYLSEYYDDIKKYFPDFSLQGEGHEKAYLVCLNSTPVGITAGKLNDDNSFTIDFDYAFPVYRDCSVGAFLYKYLNEKCGIASLRVPLTSAVHENYLIKMGFEKKNSEFLKTF